MSEYFEMQVQTKDQIPDLVKASDDAIQRTVSLLLTKYSYFKRQRSFRRSKARIPTIVNSPVYLPRYLSPYDISNTKNSRRSILEIYSVGDGGRRNTPKGKSSSYSIDQVLTIQNIFTTLAGSYRNTFWVRGERELEISIIIIKQFWLDCSVCDSVFFGLIMKPIRNKEWINYESFLMCFEEIHNDYKWGIFSSKKSLNNMKSGLFKQKSLCKIYLVFFCVVCYEFSEDLDRDGIKKVLNMIEKRPSIHLGLWVDFYFERNKEIRPNCPSKISFNDFFEIVTNT